jgi:hypothetical protein
MRQLIEILDLLHNWHYWKNTTNETHIDCNPQIKIQILQNIIDNL